MQSKGGPHALCTPCCLCAGEGWGWGGVGIEGGGGEWAGLRRSVKESLED
jgi:hypothetical protein